MNDYPDSALCILQSISPDRIASKESRARFFLLLSIALDKNYIDLQSDSIIRYAVDYYSTKGLSDYRMKSWYYEGIVLFNAGDYPSAIVSFEHAIKDAERLDDDLYLGMSNREKASIYNVWNNFPAAIECQEKAINSFKRANKPSFASFSLLSLGIELINAKEFDKAKDVISEALEKADSQYMSDLCKLRLASISIEKDESPEYALEVLQNTPEQMFALYDYGYYAIAWEKAGKRDSANVWMNKGYDIARDEADSASLDYMFSGIASGRKDFQKAFSLVKHAADIQDTYTRNLLQESLNTALKEYYKGELDKEQAFTEKEKEQRKLIAIIVLLSVLAGVVFFKMQIDRKNRQLELQIAQFTAVQREKNLVQKENAELVGAIFSERMRHLNELSDEFFSADEKGKKELVFENYKKYLTEFRNDESAFKSLEDDLNKYSDNIMNKLSEQVPSIRGDKRKIIAMFFASVPYETIQLIMRSVSIESLRMMRSRFRKVILEANAPDAQLFLSMLYMKSGPKA